MIYNVSLFNLGRIMSLRGLNPINLSMTLAKSLVMIIISIIIIITSMLMVGSNETKGVHETKDKVSFAKSSYSVSEESGHVTIELRRTGKGVGSISADIILSGDGTASEQQDFLYSQTRTVTWDDGDVAPKKIDIVILFDALSEETETFTIALDNLSTNAKFGMKKSTNIFITDSELILFEKSSPNKRWKIRAKINATHQSEIYVIGPEIPEVKVTENNNLKVDASINDFGDYAYTDNYPAAKTDLKTVFYNKKIVKTADKTIIINHLNLTSEFLFFTEFDQSTELTSIYSYKNVSEELNQTPINGFVESVFILTDTSVLLHVYEPLLRQYTAYVYNAISNTLEKKDSSWGSGQHIRKMDNENFQSINIKGPADEVIFTNAVLSWKKEDFSIPQAFTNNIWAYQTWVYSYQLKGLVNLYLITKNEKIKLAIRRAVHGFLMTTNKYSHPSEETLPEYLWSTKRYSLDPNILLTELGDNAPILHALLLAANAGVLTKDTTLKIADIAEKAFLYFEDNYNIAESHYHFSYGTSLPYDGVWLPFNKQNHFGQVLIELYLLTGKDQYRSRVHEIAQSFRDEWEESNERALWRYWPKAFADGWAVEDNVSINYPSKTPSTSVWERTYYGGIAAGFIVRFNEVFGDSIFSAQDILNLNKTLENMFVGSKFTEYVVGASHRTGKTTYYYQPSNSWAMLSNNKLKESYKDYIFMQHIRRWVSLLNIGDYTNKLPHVELELMQFDSDLNVVSRKLVEINTWDDILNTVISLR